jgi:hypothetical protein
MGFALRKGLSFCRIADRIIFLDLSNDRYFCLSKGAAEAFVGLSPSRSAFSQNSPLQGLVADGILRETAAPTMPCPCSAPPVSGALVDDRVAAPPRKDIFEALRRRLAGEVGLRLLGLEQMIHRLSRAVGGRSPASLEVAAGASRAFAAASLWRTRQRYCLSISIATMLWLLHRGGAAHLVMGVRLHPFQAHCWVQADGLLINDDPDLIRNFTPILVV